MFGGAAGSLARYLVSMLISESYRGRFPLATFAVNVTGSLLIGLFLGWGDSLNLNHRALLVTGLLGGFTTFSALEWELVTLGRTAPPLAMFYAAASVVTGWLACWLGFMLARKI